MKPTRRPPETRGEELVALADQYVERHRAMENYIWAWYTTFNVLRRLGIDPLSWQGRLLSVTLFGIIFLTLPLLVTALAGQWATAPLRTWVVIAIVFSLLGIIIYRPTQNALDRFLSLHHVMAEEAGLRRLTAWDKRWYDVRTTISISTLFALTILGVLYLLQRGRANLSIPAGTVVLGTMLLYQVGEISYTIFMLGLESRILAGYDYELYRLSPIDSVAIQRSIRGSNQLGLWICLIATVFIIGFLFLLPTNESTLTRQITSILLAVAYLATGFGVLVPRWAIKEIVHAEKEREMAPLQRRLDALSARVRELSEAEYQELMRLKETHDIIRDSPNVLPLSTVGQLFSTLIIPTLAFLVAVAGEVLLGNLLKSTLIQNLTSFGP